MKIGLDLSITKINQAGTSIYASNLARTLQKVDPRNEYQVFIVNQQVDMSKKKSIVTRMETIYRDIIWTHGILPRKIIQAKIDLMHMPANVIPIFSPCKTVVSILDTIIFQSPEKFPIWHRNYAHLFTPFAANNASKILTISEQSKRDIIHNLKVAPDKIIVTYLAASSEFSRLSDQEIKIIQQKYDLDNFIFIVGTLEPRKNINRLLHAFAKLRKDGFTGLLVHAGPKGWLFDDMLTEISLLNLQSSVRFLGKVSVRDLVGLYNAASVFVYPSLYEGFGIPVLEAMACGCPVITSNVSSLPEVAGEAGILIDPYSVAQITEAIGQVLEDPSLARNLSERGLERAKLFSWERCAEETLAVYQQVLEE